jgi:hypothetical protein
MARELLLELGRLVDNLIKQKSSVDAVTMGEISKQIGGIFTVHPDEVAILALNEKARCLQFLVPEKLHKIGSIPMTSAGALVVRTARDRRPEIINNFPVARHVSFFEAVPLSEQTADPIQKILSAPIIVDEKVIGVIQVSRKGKNLVSAGPDFNQKDLGDLVVIANLLGPCLKLCAESLG